MDMTTPNNWMDEARQAAAQCWCDEETKDRVMDPVLAEAIAKRIAAWMADSAQYASGCDYYRGLLMRCGKAIGGAAYTADDGSIQDTVLCAKIPELVEELVEELHIMRRPVSFRFPWHWRLYFAGRKFFRGARREYQRLFGT